MTTLLDVRKGLRFLKRTYPLKASTIDSMEALEDKKLSPLVLLLEGILMLFKAATITSIDVNLDIPTDLKVYDLIRWVGKDLSKDIIYSPNLTINGANITLAYGSYGCKIVNNGTHYEVQLWYDGKLVKFMRVTIERQLDKMVNLDKITKDREEYFRTFKSMGIDLSVKDRPEITRVKVIKALISGGQYSDESISVVADYIVALIRAANSFDGKVGKSSITRNNSEGELKSSGLNTKF